jgi:ribosomal protein S18 acetylase RimI-like enzyme
VHALPLLASARAALEPWFWSGFGLLVVDALRPLPAPLGKRPPQGLTVRRAEVQDAALVQQIDAEHWEHYTRAPVFMTPHTPQSLQSYEEFLGGESNSVWLAFHGSELAGFMRFEGKSRGAADVVSDEKTAAITGAYLRPAQRGRGAAPALLEAALQHLAARGYQRCAVDFESLNPEAAAFWPKYFHAVCYSVMRIPEN